MRLSFLDSIRGGAAFIVLTSHLHYATRTETDFISWYVFRLFDASIFAVAIFFVLSGMVLFIQIEGEKQNYLQFVIRRVFRIFPASIVAVTLSYLIYVLYQPGPLPSRGPWFNGVSWPDGVSFDDFVHHLILEGPVNLLPPLWSLVIEWRVSLIFPILAALLIWSPRITGVVTALLALIIGLLPTPLVQAEGYLIAVFYASFFVAGALIGMFRLELILFFRKKPVLRYTLFIVCGYVLCFRIVGGALLGQAKLGLVGCAWIIFCMSDSKMRHLLRMRGFRFLGKISYSLYLVHIIWIGILFRALDGISPLLICVAVIAASLLSAVFLNWLIEMPFNRIGRRIAHALAWPSLKAMTVQMMRMI